MTALSWTSRLRTYRASGMPVTLSPAAQASLLSEMDAAEQARRSDWIRLAVDEALLRAEIQRMRVQEGARERLQPLILFFWAALMAGLALCLADMLGALIGGGA